MDLALVGLALLLGLGAVDLAAWATLLYRFCVGFRRSPRLEDYAEADGERRVAAVVAARNEQENIEGCVRGLLSQRPVGQVVVVDDGSSDKTFEVASRLVGDGRVRVIRLEGGGGKAAACQLGATNTDAEWLLFVDADTRLEPGAVGRALGLCEQRGLDALSVIGGLRCRGFWDKLCTPFLFGLLNSFIRLDHVCDRGKGSAYFYGSFILIRRKAYFEIGGHAAVRDQIVEDRALGGLAKKRGLNICIARGRSLVSAEWAPGFRESIRAMQRVAAPSMSGRAGLGAAFSFALTALFFIPFLALVCGMLGDPFAWIGLALAGLGACSLAFGGALSAVSARRIGSSPLYAPLFPLAAAAFSYALWSSVAKVVWGRPVVWRGRRYVFVGRRRV